MQINRGMNMHDVETAAEALIYKCYSKQPKCDTGKPLTKLTVTFQQENNMDVCDLINLKK